MGVIPTYLGAPCINDQQRDERPVNDRNTRAHETANVPNGSDKTADSHAPAPQIEAVDKTPPEDPYKLAMKAWDNPKSTFDKVKGKIPTQGQIRAFVHEFGPDRKSVV